MATPEVIHSPANAAVKAARRLAQRSGRAHASTELLVEGPSAASEALPSLRELFVTQAAAGRHRGLVAQARSAGARVHLVSDAVLSSIATTVTPQGVIGVADLPPGDLDEVVAGATLLVVLHQVRDPGNAGTAVRTADAAGADAVVVTRDSVDCRNPKAVRASAGSLFHLPVVTGADFGDVVRVCRTAGVRLVAADAGGARAHTDVDLTQPTALVFGNEAHGLAAEAVAACDEVVRIRMHDQARPGFPGTAESLNLAATVAILSFEAARQRRAVEQGAPAQRLGPR